MNCERRTFLKLGLAASAAAALPTLFSRSAIAGQPGDRVLVLVQLDGGNDGLNTVVPYGDDAYHNARPGIGFRGNAVLKLDDYAGLHPNLSALRPVWDAGDLAVVQGVGYPNPNRSHFTSTDIWHTASVQAPARWTGWMGRALDRADGGEIPALALDPGPLSLALVGEKVVVPTVADAGRFRVQGARKDLLQGLVARERTGAALEHVRRSARQAYRTSDRVDTALKDGRGRDAYPQSDLGERLWQIARMIEADLPCRVYAVRLTGVDTHSRQRDAHDGLMRILGDALGAFHKDLSKHDLQERVLTMTYSEFGRRVKENRSLGTDHGAAAPMFVMGGPAKGGLIGDHPSLTDLDDGDLKHDADFRSVYATLLDRWLRVDSKAVLGHPWPAVPFL